VNMPVENYKKTVENLWKKYNKPVENCV